MTTILPLRDTDETIAALGVDDLIRMILFYHETHLLDLSHAITLARQAERQSAKQADFPHGLTALLTRMLEGLRDHQSREEQAFAPVLEAAGSEPVGHVVGALGREHDAAQDDLERLVRLTADYEAPDGASATWRELYDVCRKFDTDFREHVRLEDRILFPRLLQLS